MLSKQIVIWVIFLIANRNILVYWQGGYKVPRSDEFEFFLVLYIVLGFFSCFLWMTRVNFILHPLGYWNSILSCFPFLQYFSVFPFIDHSLDSFYAKLCFPQYIRFTCCLISLVDCQFLCSRSIPKVGQLIINHPLHPIHDLLAS